ncbi:unnamed protein product [Brassica oleracea var. botrytis]
MVNLTNRPPPPPPPPPQFRSISSRSNLIQRLTRSQPVPRPPPPPSWPRPLRLISRHPPRPPPPRPRPPPPPPPFVPILPLPHLIISRRRRKLYHKRMLTWYLITLMMRQKLQTLNQKPEETREAWVISIKEKMDATLRVDATTSREKLCIYRVPRYLQENDKKSYFPQTVSLGPYHHGKEHLLPMEHHKWRAVNMVMKRTKHSIEMYIDAMKELEEKARACYEDKRIADFSMFFKPDVKTREDCLSQKKLQPTKMVHILTLPPPPPPPPPSFRSIPPQRHSFKKRSKNPPPSPPPQPSFGSIPRRRRYFFKKRSKNPPPAPPPPPSFGPSLPWLKRRKINPTLPSFINKDMSLIQKDMLTWYLLTLVMRQKLQTRNQQPEETREEWVISIKDKMEQTLREDATTSWERLCIYRVPQYLQENDNKSYFPQTVSLGPYHHSKDHLLPMDRHKWRALNMIMARTKQGIEMYLDAMKELEERARACYEVREERQSINLRSNSQTLSINIINDQIKKHKAFLKTFMKEGKTFMSIDPSFKSLHILASDISFLSLIKLLRYFTTTSFFWKKHQQQEQKMVAVFYKDMLSWYLLTLKIREKLETENQGSEPVNQDQNLLPLPEVTRSDQDQNNHNHDQTLSETGKIEVTKEIPKETRDDWAISITDKLEQADRDDDTTIWGKLCIYRVPYYLQENDNQSYFPQTVFLGPYHHGKKRLRSMDRHKWRAVNRILKPHTQAHLKGPVND